MFVRIGVPQLSRFLKSASIKTPLSLIILLVCTARGFAQETPALRGLGEPAATGSFANPSAIGPASSVSRNNTLQPDPSNNSPPSSPRNNASQSDLPPGFEHQPSSILKPIIQKNTINQPLTLVGAVEFAEQNYPAILRSHAQEKAAKKNITVQKLNEYLPDGLFQSQDIMASRNKQTQIIYGSPVFPGNPGPGFNSVNMYPLFFSGVGFNLDWAPLDFGLHKARIELSKEQYGQAQAQLSVTKLDTQLASANAFLDVVEAIQQVRATHENVASFEQFAKIVDAQVSAQLKPGADAALAEAQLANSRNQLLRAETNLDISKANLSNSLGVAGVDVDVVDKGLVTEVINSGIEKSAPIFEQVPVLQASKAALLISLAQKKVLKKEGYPVFHWLGGFQMRGTPMDTKGKITYRDAAGFAPVVPNYQAALIINWNFLDPIRLKYEKQVQDQRIVSQQQDYDLVLQNLKSEDSKSRSRLRTAIAIAKNMPVQVNAAEQAVHQAVARYQVGLGSVAQVAEANQVLAQSRMQEAVAKVSVWRAMLGVASVHGDLKPFLAEATRAQRGM